MSKTLLALVTIVLLGLVYTQPVARQAKNDEQTSSTAPNWSCSFNFTFNQATLYSYTLNANNANIQNGNLGATNNNNIDSVSWRGTSCYCWILLYEESAFDGDRAGFWVDTTSGTLDLTRYLVEGSDTDLDDTDDNLWIQWDKDVSSYRIYCF